MTSFAPPDAAGTRDYLAVLLEHEPKVNARLLEVCRQVPSLQALLDLFTPEQLEARRKANLDALRAAASGDWSPLRSRQRAQGELYANHDVPFGDWYQLVGALQKVM